MHIYFFVVLFPYVQCTILFPCSLCELSSNKLILINIIDPATCILITYIHFQVPKFNTNIGIFQTIFVLLQLKEMSHKIN